MCVDMGGVTLSGRGGSQVGSQGGSQKGGSREPCEPPGYGPDAGNIKRSKYHLAAPPTTTSHPAIKNDKENIIDAHIRPILVDY